VCSHAQIERCRRLVRLVNVYGPTENSVCTSINSYSATASTIDAHHTDIGEPINNTTLYCLDGNMDHASEGTLPPWLVSVSVQR
jgi:non-ribosomal peptide synthetase component F